MKPDTDVEYLTMREAAKFCCVSYEHFCRERASYGIYSIHFMGKNIFRKSDLIKAVERYAPFPADE